MRKIHDSMLGQSIIGFDVLPSAVHLTVSSLAGIFPKKTIKTTNIGTAILGKKNDMYHLGSLDFILDDSTLGNKGVFIVGNKTETYTDHGIRNNSIDYIIMNPPFTSNTKGGMAGHAMFASFDTSEKDQKQMSTIEKTRFQDTCADGNAGQATHFVAVADKKLKPGGTMGLVLPLTSARGASWEKFRELLRTKYKDIIVVSIAGSTTADGSFSFDTNMNEILVIAKKESAEKIKMMGAKQAKIDELEDTIKKYKTILKKSSKKNHDKGSNTPEIKEKQQEIKAIKNQISDMHSSKRGKFTTLKHRPRSILNAMEIVKQIRNNERLIKLDGATKGTTQIIVGSDSVGSMMDCPISFDWWFVGVNDAYLLQIGYNLINGIFSYLDGAEYKVPMTVLGNNFGPLSRDTADNSPDGTRAPFTTSSLNGTAIYFGLDKNNSKTQKSIKVKPDSMAIPKANATPANVEKIANTATHLHINKQGRYTSQRMLVLYTDRRTIGTGELPSYNIDEKYEKAFAIWGNSTLGIFCFWLGSSKQQFGRVKTSHTGWEKMNVLDFSKLADDQLEQFNELFEDYADKDLKPMKNMNVDKIRKEIDQKILKILKIDQSIDDLRDRLCREKTID